MRGPNKMPHGVRPSKKGLKQNYIYHVSADISADDNKWINDFAKAHNISKAEVVRRCIRGSKLYMDLLAMKEKERIKNE